MTTLTKYFHTTGSYHTTPEDNNTVLIPAVIPLDFEHKVNQIIQVKGYVNRQEYLRSLFDENKELEEIVIPYEILRRIDEDYFSIQGLYADIHRTKTKDMIVR